MKKKCLRLTHKLKSKYEKLSLKGIMVSVYQLFEKIHLFLKDNHPSSVSKLADVCSVKAFLRSHSGQRRCTLIG